MMEAFVIFDPVFNKNGDFVSYRFVYINKAYEEITGVKYSKVKGKTVHEIWPETEESWVEKYGHVSTTGETLIFDNYHEPTKKLYHCRVFRPWENSQRFCVVFEDITESANKELENKQAREEAERYLDMAGNMFLLLDPKGNISLINQKGLEILGYERDELIGKNWFNTCIPENLKEKVKAVFSKVFEGRLSGVEHYNNEVLRKTGETRMISWYNTYIRDEKGQVISILSSGMDITQQYKTQIELVENEKLLRTVSDNYPNSYMSIINDDYTVGFTSGQEFKKLNLNPQDYVGVSLEEVYGENFEYIKEKYAKTFKGEEQDFELFINDQYQHYKTVPLKDKDGNIDRILSVVENITERKMSEQELIKLNEALQAAQEMAKVGYWSFDIKTQMPIWSDQMFKICGYKKEDGVPAYMDQKKTWHPDDWDMFDAAVKACEKGTPYNIVVRIWSPEDNSYHYVNTQGFPKRDEDGIITELFGTSQDITEIKKAELEIKEREKKYRSLIDSMMNAFALHEMIFDKNGNPVDYRFLEVNPAWEKVVGIKEDKVIGKTIREIMPDVEMSWIELYGRIVKTGEPEDFEDYNQATDKYYHVFAYRPEEGKFAAFFNDVTKRKKLN